MRSTPLVGFSGKEPSAAPSRSVANITRRLFSEPDNVMDPKTNATTASGSGSAPTMEPKPAPGSARRISPGAPAQPPVPTAGAPRGGRPRKDGLAPGSPQALEADKKNDRLRKQEQRGIPEPPALPGAVAPLPGQGPTAPAPLAAGPVAALGLPEVPWTGEDFREYLDEALSGAEEARVETRKLQAMAAGFSNDRIKELAADARYPGSSKKMIGLAGSNGLARIFNKVRFSKDYGEGASRGAGGRDARRSQQTLGCQVQARRDGAPEKEPAKPGEEGMIVNELIASMHPLFRIPNGRTKKFLVQNRAGLLSEFALEAGTPGFKRP